MNTLVDVQDGGISGPETRPGNASKTSASGDGAGAPPSPDATVIDVEPPRGAAPTAPLVELAPESGRTLILPDGPPEETKRAWAKQLPGFSAAPARRPSPG